MIREERILKEIFVPEISTNFINNLYIGVNEASNPLSHLNHLYLAQINF